MPAILIVIPDLFRNPGYAFQTMKKPARYSSVKAGPESPPSTPPPFIAKRPMTSSDMVRQPICPSVCRVESPRWRRAPSAKGTDSPMQKRNAGNTTSDSPSISSFVAA